MPRVHMVSVFINSEEKQLRHGVDKSTKRSFSCPLLQPASPIMWYLGAQGVTEERWLSLGVVCLWLFILDPRWSITVPLCWELSWFVINSYQGTDTLGTEVESCLIVSDKQYENGKSLQRELGWGWCCSLPLGFSFWLKYWFFFLAHARSQCTAAGWVHQYITFQSWLSWKEGVRREKRGGSKSLIFFSSVQGI